MRRLVTIIALIWASAAAAQPMPEQGPGRIAVTGEGSVMAAPDQATLQLGVTSRGPSAADAVAEVGAATAGMLERIAEAGISEQNVQTSNLRLMPLREDQREPNAVPKIIGYEAASDLTVTTSDLDGLGALLDAVLGAGATQFDGLSFGLADPAPQTDEARRAAVADARAKAELYAEAAGVTLGRVVSLDEIGGRGPQPMFRADFARAESSPVPVAQGQIEVSEQVNMVFEIAPQP